MVPKDHFPLRETEILRGMAGSRLGAAPEYLCFLVIWMISDYWGHEKEPTGQRTGTIQPSITINKMD